MRRRKDKNNELLLEFNFLDDESASDVTNEAGHAHEPHPAEESPSAIDERPIVRREEELSLFKQIDALLQRIGNKNVGDTRLVIFIINSYYGQGKSLAEVAQMISEGVIGVPRVTRERVRMIVAEFREEFLSSPTVQKRTRGLTIKRELVQAITEYHDSHIGYVVKESNWLSSPRLGAIAYLLHQKIIAGDTVIPWVKMQKILLDERIEKREFNAHYAALFYLLQAEVRPMAFEDILRRISEQPQMEGQEVREGLLALILQHDEVFEKVAEGTYQLREAYLNVKQRLARIIYEVKEVSPSDLVRMYTERHGETFSSMAIVSKGYPWCVPVGKSKWIYREDGVRLRKPAEIIQDFCKERVRFTLQDVLEYMNLQGVNIKEASVRCYILRICRPLNADGNTFCLDSDISEEEDYLWRSRTVSTNRICKKEWRKKMEKKIRTLLNSAPMNRMLQKDVMNQSRYILDNEGIAYNNFYKVLKTFSWLQTTTVEGETYLELIK